VYDGLRRLRSRAEFVWIGSGWYPNTTTLYVYDGRRVVQERNSANGPTVSYVRGLDLSGTSEGAGGIGGLLARSSGYQTNGSWTSHAFYHADGGGNVTFLSPSTYSGTMTRYSYDAYGRTTSLNGPLATANVYRFSSKELHAASGHYYYGYRFYDPQAQRWINRDPLGEAGGMNLYQFVKGNPSKHYDPHGLATGFEEAAVAIGGPLVLVGGVTLAWYYLNPLYSPITYPNWSCGLINPPPSAIDLPRPTGVGPIVTPIPSDVVPPLVVRPPSPDLEIPNPPVWGPDISILTPPQFLDGCQGLFSPPRPSCSSAPSVGYGLPSDALCNSAWPPGFIDAVAGAKKWGGKEAVRRFHRWKEEFYSPTDNMGVNPITGAIVDPDGNIVDYLEDINPAK